MDWTEDTFLDELPKRSYTGLRDYHLRSALTTMAIGRDNIDDSDYRLREEVDLFYRNFPLKLDDPSKFLGRIFIDSPIGPFNDKSLDLTEEALKVESCMFQNVPVPLLSDAEQYVRRREMKTKYFGASQFLQNAIIISNALHAGKELPRWVKESPLDRNLGIVTLDNPALGLTLRIGIEVFIAKWRKETGSLFTIDHLRNWSDKLTERFNIEISCQIGHSLNEHVYPPVSSIYELWSVIDRCLVTHGNSTYKLVKLFEAIVIGVLLDKNPNDHIDTNTDFLLNTIRDFKAESEPELCETLDKLVHYLQDQHSAQYLSQMYGLYRCWGHPVVIPREGMQKVYQLGTKMKTVCTLTALQVRRVFMTKYSVWHKKVKGVYPKLTGEIGSEICSLMKDNCVTATLERTITSPAWDSVKFCKTIEIPKTYNLSEMVADKAISPDLNVLIDLSLKGGKMYDANSRRGVLQWLLRTPETCEAFLTRVAEEGLNHNELIIGLYQKEREVNEKPRMFALMSHAIRNYVVTTESMLSSDILPAFPQVTMTDPLLNLQKKIYSVSRKTVEGLETRGFRIYKEVTIIVNIDFEKWNLNFRKETTSPVFQALGDLYGLNDLFDRTYDIFSNSFIYLADGSYRPLVNDDGSGLVCEEPLSYRGHLGGFEGLRQKGWTIFTVCALELICGRHNCSYTIMGQGDNQVLALTWKSYLIGDDGNISQKGKRRMSAQFFDFMNDLTMTFGELGLPVKALETWSSEHLFLYGKYPTLRGVPLAMSLKKICRAYYLANEEIMTLDCALATIQSNTMAACMSDVTSFVPYVIYKIQVYLALLAYKRYHVLLGSGAFDMGQLENEWRFTSSAGTKLKFKIPTRLNTDKLLILLSWFPKILGGLNVIGWPEFLMRGFPDKATAGFTWVKGLLDTATDNEMISVLRSIYSCHLNDETNFVLLVEDPCALNLVVPIDARTALKQSVQELFENMDRVQNREFANLFKFNESWDKENLCQKLCEFDILHPRFLHDVAAATLGGYVDSVVSKISKASTINKIALRSSSKNPGEKIEFLECNYMGYLIWKCSKQSISSFIYQECPTEQARIIRLKSWNKIIEGVTVPYPLAFLGCKRCSDNPSDAIECDGNYISVTLPESLATGDMSILNRLGRSPPYLGSETREKIGADPSRQVFGREPLIARPLKLLRVVNWFVPPESNAHFLIRKLLEAVSDLDPDQYTSREMGITGSEAHRYRDQALKHGVMSANMYTLGSHMHISTDPWIKYTRGAENFTINYQAVLCTIQALVGSHLFHHMRDYNAPSREYHFHETCPSCIVPLDDTFHDFISRDCEALIPSGKNNQYLWVDEASLSLKYLNDPLFGHELNDMSYDEYLGYSYKRRILTEWIAVDVLTDVLMASQHMIVPRLLDSKDYPRVLYKKLSVKELWEELAIMLISSAGMKYHTPGSLRSINERAARGLAADDLMKASSKSLMGASMFYTWPEKFSEIERYDNASIFPDTNPPTLESICQASQMNLREIIRKVVIQAPNELIIPRTAKNPIEWIKRYWYRILLSETMGCPSCIHTAMNLEFPDPLRIPFDVKCSLNHLVITDKMTRIFILTASADRLLKDSTAYREPEHQITRVIGRYPPCPTTYKVWDSLGRLRYEEYQPNDPLIDKRVGWEYIGTLPTISKCRVLETLSILEENDIILHYPQGVIFGDGLGRTSAILGDHFQSVKWTVGSLQDSEQAVPQSYPHILIPENPSPRSNIDYSLTKRIYNDLTNPVAVAQWRNWTVGGICWFEAESKGEQTTMILNVVSMHKWDLLIIRSDFPSCNQLLIVLETLIDLNYRVSVFQCGSLDISNYEVIIIGDRQSQVLATRSPNINDLRASLMAASQYINQKIQSLLYAEYLTLIEDKSEVAKMLRRLDHWYAQVGLTHLLSCGKLLTPIWWDLQTGAVPEWVANVGSNKRYYMYKSDMIALQSRLVLLLITTVESQYHYAQELKNYRNWILIVSRKNDKVTYVLKRSQSMVNYGPDQLKMLKLAPILRKLHAVKGRLSKELTDNRYTFAPGRDSHLKISKLALSLPNSLPEFL
ncbi:TPA_asm: L [Hibiscus gammacytorhabdovirus 1]|nr:TPA_asm: L [Hibiscus gammacytorhabdovirus 1]